MTFASISYTANSQTTNGKRNLDTSAIRKIRSLREKFATGRLSILDWYRILRVHHGWTIFQAIRFALWLAR